MFEITYKDKERLNEYIENRKAYEASLRLTEKLVCASLHGGNAAAS